MKKYIVKTKRYNLYQEGVGNDEEYDEFMTKFMNESIEKFKEQYDDLDKVEVLAWMDGKVVFGIILK